MNKRIAMSQVLLIGLNPTKYLNVDYLPSSNKTEQCESCQYKQLSTDAADGWCYMFENAPTEKCGQHRDIG